MGSTLLRICVSLIFLGLFGWSLRGNFSGVMSALRGVDVGALAIGFLLAFTSGLLMGWRLRLVFRAQGLALSFRNAIHLTFIGLFFNNFLPSAVGGDLVKGYCASLETGKRTESFSACLMDRILGLFVFILIPSIAVFFLLNELDPRIPRFVLLMLAIASAGLLLIFNKHHVNKLAPMAGWLTRLPGMKQIGSLYHAMHELTRNKWLVLRICVIAAGGQILNIFSIWMVVRALGATVAIEQLLIRTPLVHLFGMLPSFGGLGLREKGFEYFFKPIIGHESAGALAILYLFYIILLSAIGGIVYMIRHDYHFSFKNIKLN